MLRHHRRRTPGDLPGLDIAEEKSWQNYLKAALRFEAAIDRRLTAEHHLPVIDLRVLDILAKSAEGSVRMGDLAAAVGSSTGQLAKRVRRLEGRNLVRREPCPDDRRGVMAVVTDDGLAMVAKATVTYAQEVQARLLAPLSRTQVATTEENCRRINAGLKRLIPPTDSVSHDRSRKGTQYPVLDSSTALRCRALPSSAMTRLEDPSPPPRHVICRGSMTQRLGAGDSSSTPRLAC